MLDNNNVLGLLRGRHHKLSTGELLFLIFRTSKPPLLVLNPLNRDSLIVQNIGNTNPLVIIVFFVFFFIIVDSNY